MRIQKKPECERVTCFEHCAGFVQNPLKPLVKWRSSTWIVRAYIEAYMQQNPFLLHIHTHIWSISME